MIGENVRNIGVLSACARVAGVCSCLFSAKSSSSSMFSQCVLISLFDPFLKVDRWLK